MTDNATRSTTRLSRRRLAPGGAAGAGALVWATRAAGLAVGAASLLLLFTLFRPLETFDAPAPAPVLRTPEIRLGAVENWETRQQIVDGLSRNRFTNDPTQWGATNPLEGESVAGGETGAADPARPGAGSTQARTTAPGQAEIRITNPQDLFPDTLAALEAIRLSSIYAVDGNDRRGFTPGMEPVYAARINFLHAKRDSSTAPFPGVVVKEGDVFFDPNLKNEKEQKTPWEVLLVDAQYDRVILRRNKDNLVLALYDGLPVPEVVRTRMRMDDDRIFFKPEDIYVAGASRAELDQLLETLRNDGTISAEDQAELAGLMEDPEFGRTNIETLLPDQAQGDAKNDAPPEFPPALAEALRHMMSGGDPKDLERLNLQDPDGAATPEEPETDDNPEKP